MSELSFLQSLESFYLSKGCATKLSGRTLMVKCEEPMVIELTPDSSYVRVAVLTDVELGPEDVWRIARSNFFSYGYKAAIDSEGYLTIITEVPYKCVKRGSPAHFHEDFVGPLLKAARELGASRVA